jgi:hypothetical protein
MNNKVNYKRYFIKEIYIRVNINITVIIDFNSVVKKFFENNIDMK